MELPWGWALEHKDYCLMKHFWLWKLLILIYELYAVKMLLNYHDQNCFQAVLDVLWMVLGWPWPPWTSSSYMEDLQPTSWTLEVEPQQNKSRKPSRSSLQTLMYDLGMNQCIYDLVIVMTSNSNGSGIHKSCGSCHNPYNIK